MGELLCPRCSAAVPASSPCGKCRGSGKARCTKCGGSGRHEMACGRCSGFGMIADCKGKRKCENCNGRGVRNLGECFRCEGGNKHFKCDHCDVKPWYGEARAFCTACV